MHLCAFFKELPEYNLFECWPSSFYVLGEVRYSKNNTKVATLMHVDKTLPLWLFFDVYGNIQKIRSIGNGHSFEQYVHVD